jgi:DNA repair exonuclease SbcCD ATPase subunit
VVRESVVAATPVGPQQERLIIRNGQLVLTVEDTRATQQSIEQMVAEMAGEGAFVVSSSERVGPDQNSPYISLHIRIPVTRFDEVIDRLAAMAVEVRDRNETAQDVTEEYVDLQARLESLEAARQRLLEIMQAAQTTEDLLLAEQQLTQREAEIESIKGRLQYLAQSAQLSSITIELWPYLLSQPLDTRWRPAETAREAFETLVNGLRSFGDFVIFVTIAVLPWLALGGLVVYGAVRLVRRWRKPQSKPSAE